MTVPGRTMLSYFGSTYLVNLPARTDRLRDTRTEMQALDAAASARVVLIPGIAATDAHGFPSLGAYGCFQAHLNALKLAVETGLDSLLVLEDDVCFDAVSAEDWPNVAAALETEPWDLINLGFDAKQVTPAASDGVLVPQSEPLSLTHCYAVRGAIFQRLIDYMEILQKRQPGDPLGGPMHYDGVLYHFCKDNPDVVRLRPRRSLAGQRSSRSDIADPRWFDRPPFQAVSETLRSLRTRFLS